MIKHVVLVSSVLVAVVRKAAKALRKKPVCPLIDDDRLMSVREKIVECLKDSPEWKTDLANMRLASKAFRRFVNSTMPHVNATHMASVGGNINDLLAFPDVSSLEVDFGMLDGDPETLTAVLTQLHELRSLRLSNIHLPPAVTNKMYNLIYLRKLFFHDIEVEGLSFLSEIKSLTQLHLYGVNVLQPSLESLTELTELQLLTVHNSDELLKNNFHWIAHSSSIRNVSIAMKVFTFDDVRSLSVLKGDLALTIHGLDSKGSFSSLLSLPTLKSLSLQSCDLVSLQFQISELRALEHLSLSSEQLSASDTKDLLFIRTQLRSLNLELTNTDRTTLGMISRSGFPLVSLAFGMKFLEVDESLGLLTNLKALSIRSTQDLSSAETLTCLRSLTKLKELTIVGCANCARVLEVLPDFGGNLKNLVIDWSPIIETDLQVIAQECSLKRLALLRCTILNSLEPLNELQSLQDLVIDCCLAIEANLHRELNRPFLARLKTLRVRLSDEASFEDSDELVRALRQRVPYVVFEQSHGFNSME